MPDAFIRPIAPEDRAEWGRLWADYLAFYETSLSNTVFEATFARLCSLDHPDQNAFVAVREGQLVGLVHYIYHAHNWRLEPVCYLQDLYVAPSVRGTGLGRQLIEAVYAKADTDGRPSVYWMTQDFNTTARKLYDRLGAVTPFIKYIRP